MDEFHAREAGITERVVQRCRDDHGADPYDWLVDAIPPTIRSVIDIGCGSAPLRDRIGDRDWVGIDRSAAELRAARAGGSGCLILGDATYLALRSDLGRAAVYAMSLMVATPIADVITEIVRVIGPQGRLVALMPSPRPLTWSDRLTYGRLMLGLRERPRFPEERVLGDPAAVLAGAGMTVVGDESRRFEYSIDDRADADRFVDSLYLRRAGPDRRATASRALARRGGGIAVAFRRIVARPAGTSNG